MSKKQIKQTESSPVTEGHVEPAVSPQNPTVYKIYCAACHSTNNLQMYAHRSEGKMVGWIFCCANCIDKSDRPFLKVTSSLQMDNPHLLKTRTLQHSNIEHIQ